MFRVRWWYLVSGFVILGSGISITLIVWIAHRQDRLQRQRSREIVLQIDTHSYTLQTVLERIRRLVPEETLADRRPHMEWLIRNYLEDFLLLELVRVDASRWTQGVAPQKIQTHALVQSLPPDPTLMREANALVALNYAFYMENPEALQITESDIRQYYATHRKMFYRKERVLLVQIAFDRAEEAERVYHQIQVVPELFDHYLYLVTEGDRVIPGMHAQSGFIGLVDLDDLPEDIRTLVRKTRIGECAPPIQIGSVYVIFKILDRRPEGIAPLEEVAHEIQMRILDERIERALRAWIPKWLRRHRIHIAWARLHVRPEDVHWRWIPASFWQRADTPSSASQE